MEQRTTRKGQSDNYLQARNAILNRAKNPDAAKFMWLEVVEGKQPDAIDYVIHASAEASSVPPFAIEVYEHGNLQSYEVGVPVIKQHSVMPEELRQRIVRAQAAGDMIEKLVTTSSERAPAVAL